MDINELENGGYPEQGQYFIPFPDREPEIVCKDYYYDKPLRYPKCIRKKYHSPKRQAIETTKLFQRATERAFFKALKLYKAQLNESEKGNGEISDSLKKEMDRRHKGWR